MSHKNPTQIQSFSWHQCLLLNERNKYATLPIDNYTWSRDDEKNTLSGRFKQQFA